MKNIGLKLLIAAVILVPVGAMAQRADIFQPNEMLKAPKIPDSATVITKEDIEAVAKGQLTDHITDENVKVADLGYENMSLGMIHRGTTHVPPRPPRPENPNRVACGTTMATPPAGALEGGITHDFQTEAYYILSGGGEMFTGGHIVNGSHSLQDNAGGPNGPTCDGLGVGSEKRTVKAGDVVIIPAGVVHGWDDIPDHVDYISFRPSQKALQGGWVNPHVAK